MQVQVPDWDWQYIAFSTLWYTSNEKAALAKGGAMVHWLREPRLLAWSLYLRSQWEDASPADLQPPVHPVHEGQAHARGRTVAMPEHEQGRPLRPGGDEGPLRAFEVGQGQVRERVGRLEPERHPRS